MTAAPDTPAALLVELAALGIELQAHGARLRFRPQSAMTDDLLARVEPHQPGLLAVLADTETRAGDAATGVSVVEVATCSRPRATPPTKPGCSRTPRPAWGPPLSPSNACFLRRGCECTKRRGLDRREPQRFGYATAETGLSRNPLACRLRRG
jgi:hypothetical protein